MRSDKIAGIFNSYVAEVEKLDLQWFEWRGRLVLSAADVDKFLKKNAVFVRLLKSFVHPGPRPKIRRHSLTTQPLQGPNVERLVSNYQPFQCGQCG